MPDEPTVLVVEDDEELAHLYSDWLVAEYSVRTAFNGHEALELLDDDVDVLFLDRRMPDLSGDRVLERLREAGIRCRVAMLTAVDPDFDIIEMGFDEYLNKPVTRQEILEVAERLLRRTTYDETLSEYLSLVSKRASLRAEKPPEALESSEEYARLEERIAELEAIVDPIARDFDNEDVAAVLRDAPLSS